MTDEHNRNLLRILIAEDEKNIGDLLGELLNQDDREITLVQNGLEALEKLKEQRYDLLITDLMMPEIDGMEVLHQAKKLHPDIMVIIITGYASLETAIQAVKEGAYDYLRKPFRLEELKISVDNACEKIRLQRENQRLIQYVKAFARAEKERSQSKEAEQAKGLNQKALFGPEWFSPFMFQQHNGSVDKEAVLTQLERLAKLKAQGAITEEEFSTLKKKLFDQI
ncbi:MAG: response regulator [Thermodesulfobacteria bacterium]|nr:response regulator [Thermodesulfobacteriota bacterium]